MRQIGLESLLRLQWVGCFALGFAPARCVAQIDRVVDPYRSGWAVGADPPHRRAGVGSELHNVGGAAAALARPTVPERDQQIAVARYEATHGFVGASFVVAIMVRVVAPSVEFERCGRVGQELLEVRAAGVIDGRRWWYSIVATIPACALIAVVEVLGVFAAVEGHRHVQGVAMLERDLGGEPVGALRERRDEAEFRHERVVRPGAIGLPRLGHSCEARHVLADGIQHIGDLLAQCVDPIGRDFARAGNADTYGKTGSGRWARC